MCPVNDPAAQLRKLVASYGQKKSHCHPVHDVHRASMARLLEIISVFARCILESASVYQNASAIAKVFVGNVQVTV